MAESVRRLLLRDILPTLLMLLVTGALTLLIADCITDSREASALGQQLSPEGGGGPPT